MRTVRQTAWVLLAPILYASAALAQTGTAPQEVELKKFTNMEAKDTATKLDIVTQSGYANEVEMQSLNFRLEYGDRIRLRRVPSQRGSRLSSRITAGVAATARSILRTPTA